MASIVGYLRGKKTYCIVLMALLCLVLRNRGIEIPEEVWGALAALGLGFLRAGVKAVSDTPTD